MIESLRLVTPAAEFLSSYGDALRRGWSSSSTRDVSAEQLQELTADPEAFVAEMARREGGTVRIDDGRVMPKIPSRTLWMWDGEICGSINVRHLPGTAELPEHVSGHIGYAVVPWKQGRGYARRALALMLPVAASLGLPYVILTCDIENDASRAVILANGGLLVCQDRQMGRDKLVFRIDLTP